MRKVNFDLSCVLVGHRSVRFSELSEVRQLSGLYLRNTDYN